MLVLFSEKEELTVSKVFNQSDKRNSKSQVELDRDLINLYKKKIN